MPLARELAREFAPFVRKEALRGSDFGRRVVIRAIPLVIVLMVVQIVIELVIRWLKAKGGYAAVMGAIDQVSNETDPEMLVRYEHFRRLPDSERVWLED